MQKEDLEKYLDKDNKVIAWPNTAESRQLVCDYLASLFECDNIYTEREAIIRLCVEKTEKLQILKSL